MTTEKIDLLEKEIDEEKDSEDYLRELIGILDLHISFDKVTHKHGVIKIHVFIGGHLVLDEALFIEYWKHLNYLLKFLPKKQKYKIVISNLSKRYENIVNEN